MADTKAAREAAPTATQAIETNPHPKEFLMSNHSPSRLTQVQLDGHACIWCDREFTTGATSAPADYTESGRQLFACLDWGCDAPDRRFARRVGERMRAIVEASELTAPQLADAADIPVDSLRAELTGEQPWQLDHLERVCDALHISPLAAVLDTALNAALRENGGEQ